MAIPISADEKRWRAQDDAHTLAQARVIQQDPDRLAAAKVEAQRMADEQAEQAAAMRNVAKSGGRTRAGASTSTPGRKPDVASETQPGGGKFNVFKRVGK